MNVYSSARRIFVFIAAVSALQANAKLERDPVDNSPYEKAAADKAATDVSARELYFKFEIDGLTYQIITLDTDINVPPVSKTGVVLVSAQGSSASYDKAFLISPNPGGGTAVLAVLNAVVVTSGPKAGKAIEVTFKNLFEQPVTKLISFNKSKGTLTLE